MGYVTRDVPVGHPDFGKAFPCTCQHAAIQARRAANLRALGNLDLVGDKTFDNFLTDLPLYSTDQNASLHWSLTQAREYAAHPKGWLLFSGNYGSGKTHLAVAIANYRLEQGDEVLFMTVPDLLDHLRATFAPSTEIAYDDLFERLRNVPLLILDDLGAESATPWAQEKLFQLINHRYLHRLCTVVTTNVDLERIDPRVRSRLLDRTLTVQINMPLPDFRRLDASQDQNPIFDLGLYGDMVFEAFDFREHTLPERERRNLRHAYEIALEYAQQPQDWLLLIGTHGCGKTFLAASIANYRHAQGDSVILVTVPDLLDYLRATFGPTTNTAFSKRFYEIRSVSLLILDQLDLTNASSWALEKIRQIVDYRYLKRLPTVFTTTQPLEDLDPQIRSRVLDTRRCHVFAILAPDYQGGRSGIRVPQRRGES